MAIYGLTHEELYDRVEDAQKKIAEVVFHRENPTVEEYLSLIHIYMCIRDSAGAGARDWNQAANA